MSSAGSDLIEIRVVYLKKGEIIPDGFRTIPDRTSVAWLNLASFLNAAYRAPL